MAGRDAIIEKVREITERVAGDAGLEVVASRCWAEAEAVVAHFHRQTGRRHCTPIASYLASRAPFWTSRT